MAKHKHWSYPFLADIADVFCDPQTPEEKDTTRRNNVIIYPYTDDRCFETCSAAAGDAQLNAPEIQSPTVVLCCPTSNHPWPEARRK